MNTTQEEKRIRLAQACGWRSQASQNQNFKVVWVRGDEYTFALPDYFGDLNACHEAEKALFNKGDWRLIRQYFAHLSPNLHEDDALDSDDWLLRHATAAQCAEALGLALGLWKEGE